MTNLKKGDNKWNFPVKHANFDIFQWNTDNKYLNDELLSFENTKISHARVNIAIPRYLEDSQLYDATNVDLTLFSSGRHDHKLLPYTTTIRS